MAARRALAGAPPEGQGYEYRRIATVLERGVSVLARVAALEVPRLEAAGAHADVASLAGELVGLSAAVRYVALCLELIDERLAGVDCTALLVRLARREVVVAGAVADLLLDTGALGTERAADELRSVARARLQQRIALALTRERSR